jgi:hypothetical protein
MKNIFGKSFNRTLHAALLTVIALTLATTTVTERALAQDSQSKGQATTEAYARKLTTARPYPLGAMNDSTERAQLSERLQRMNDPNKIGYVTLLSANGQVIATFTIKGKISSTGSQLTNTQNVQVKYSTATVVDSMGDDGSYGPEEGGKKGIFFFTTAGVLVEWNGVWQYADAPVHLTTPPLVVLSADAKPSTNEGHLLGQGQK